MSEVEDGMGFSGLAPTAEERGQDAYEDTRRKIARARENALATAVAQVAHLRSALTLAKDSLLGATYNDEYGEYDGFSSGVMCVYGAMIDAAPTRAMPLQDHALSSALRKFVNHYPHGINPYLDEAYSEARDALAAEESKP